MKAFTGAIAAAVLSCACATGVTTEGETTEVTADMVATCNSASGVLPTQASLAVAMAVELRRWEPLTDLVVVSNNGILHVELSAAGLAHCTALGSDCANTKAILSLQDQSTTQVIQQSVFNPTTFRQELVSAFARQANRINDLTNNFPSQVPAPHELTLLGGPTDLGSGACGPHYVFAPTSPGGGTYPNPQNLINKLYFFGEPQNPYLGFAVSNGNVLVDPIDGDNAPPTATTGTCPTYELDRVYNPDASLLGTCCVTVDGVNGALESVPRAAGYLGCKGGVQPTN